MISLLVAVLALASSAVAFENRDGAAAHVRIFNFLDTNVEGTNALPAVLSRNTAIEYNSATVRVETVFGSTRVAIFPSVPASGTPANNAAFTLVDVEGLPNNLNITLTQTGVSTPDNTVCTATIQPDKRNTVVITQSVSGEFVPEPTCTAANQVCTQIDETQKVAGRVSFSCAVFVEDLEDRSVDDCTFDTVNIWRFDPLTSSQFIFRSESADDSLGLEDDERVIIGTELASSPTGANPDIRDLKQTIQYQIKDQDVFDNAPARRHDFFWGADGGAVFIAQSLQTGRFAVLNAAYRTNAAGTSLNSTFDIEVVQNNIAVHADFDIISGSKTDFVELPVGTYTFNVYVDASTTTLFGQRSTSTAKSAISIASATITITADQYSVIVLQGGTADISTSAPTINQVDVTESSNVDASTTEFEVFNLVQNLPLVFAAPDDDCCNFINDANSVQPGVSNSVTFNSANIPDTSFNAYASGAQCTSLASSLIESNALTLTRSNNGNGCERKAIFLIGRAGQVEDNISGNGDCSTCTSDRNVIADVRQVGAVSSSSNVQQVEFIVPMCDCDDDDTFVDPCLVCDADEFATLNAKIDAVRASVAAASSNQLSAIDDLEDDISKVDKNVDGLEKDAKDIESAVGDVEDQIDSAIDDISDVHKDVKDIRSRL